MMSWQTIYRSAWMLLALLVAVGLACVFWPVLRQYHNYRRREVILEREIQHEQRTINTLRENQKEMKTNPHFVERVAHDLGMARADETIFKYTGDDLDQPVPRK